MMETVRMSNPVLPLAGTLYKFTLQGMKTVSQEMTGEKHRRQNKDGWS